MTQSGAEWGTPTAPIDRDGTAAHGSVPVGVARSFGARAKGPALWLAVLLLAATIVFWLLDLQGRWELSYLNLAGNIVFIGVASCFIAAAGIRGFLRSGAWPLLWLGAGSLVFGLGITIASLLLLRMGPNPTITAHNLSALLAGLLHFLGAFFTANQIAPVHSVSGRRSIVRQVYGAALALVSLIAVSAIAGFLPPFFVQGEGGTPLRQWALATDTVLFFGAGLVFLRQYATSRVLMVYWYALGLLLTSLGLGANLMISATGTVLNWTGRAAQWVGGIYLLVAALVTLGEAIARRLRPDEVLAGYFLRRESNLALLFNSIMDAVIVTDQEFAITGWNHGAEAIYGCQAEEVIGRSVVDVLQTEYRNGGNHTRALRELLVAGVWQGEVIQRHRSGREVAVLSSVSALRDEAGRVVGAVAVNRDITERRLADEEIQRLNADLERRAVELQASNRELEAFAYSVSHDLRAPLRGIDGFSQALQEDCADRLDETGMGYLRMLRQNAQRMGRLIDDLLTLSRVGRQQLQPQKVRLADVVQRAWEDLRADSTGQPVELRVGSLPVAEADVILLQQVYANLLSNALKFSSGRSPAIIDVGCQQMDGETVLYVKDNGAGFDMQYVGKIFGVFQRLHRAEDYEGTGVGLAIVQRIVQRHGGRVWAEGRVGEGASFYFTLGGALSGKCD